MAEVAKGIIDIEINTGNSAQVLRSLQAQINAFNMSLNSGARDQAQFAAKYAKDLQFAINQTGAFTAETVKLSTAAATLDKNLSKGKVSLGQFFSAKFNKDSAIAAETMALAAERAKRMQTQFIATSAAAKGFQGALAVRPLTELSSQISIASERTQILSTMFKQGTTQLINFGKNVQWAGRQLMVGFTVPLTIFGNTAAKTFTELEQSAIRFKRVYGDIFTTEAETARALESVENLAKSYTKYNIAVKDTISLAADLAAAGYQGVKLNEAIAQTNRLSTLGNIDQQKSMNTIISLQNAFEISTKELAGTIDYLNSVENQTIVSLDDITEAVPRVAPVIKGLGGDVRDLTVFLAAMEEGGVSAEQGANALKSGLASLINPTKSATETMAGFGINLKQIVETNKGDLMGTVTGLGEALATLSDFQKQQSIEAIFGKYQFARLGALFTNIVKEGGQANKVLELTRQSAIELAFTANKELGAVENAVSNKFRAAIEDLKVSIAPIGEIFLKVSIPVLNFLEKIIDKFNGLSDGKKQFIAIATIITGVVIPAGTMFFGLLMNLVGTLLKLSQGFGSFAKGFITGGPIGAIRALSQSSKYLSLAEIDAAMAAQQLATASESVNAAFMEQVGAAGAAQGAVNGLTRAYMDLIATQSQAARLPGFATPALASRKVRGYSNGVISVPGSGNKDTVPAMLTPGEAVIPADMARKYAPLITAISADKIPGYSKGVIGGESTQKAWGDLLRKNLGISGEERVRIIVEGDSPAYSRAGIMAPRDVNDTPLGMTSEYMGSIMGQAAQRASVQTGLENVGVSSERVAEVMDRIGPILDRAAVQFDDTIQGWQQTSQQAFSSIEQLNILTEQELVAVRQRIAPKPVAEDYPLQTQQVFDVGPRRVNIRNEGRTSRSGERRQIQILAEQGYDVSNLDFAHLPGYEKIAGSSTKDKNVVVTRRGKDVTPEFYDKQDVLKQAQLDAQAYADERNKNVSKKVNTASAVGDADKRKSPAPFNEQYGKEDGEAYANARQNAIKVTDKRASQQAGALGPSPVNLGSNVPLPPSVVPQYEDIDVSKRGKFLNTLARPLARIINGKNASAAMAAGATAEEIALAEAKDREEKGSRKASIAASNFTNKVFAASMAANALGGAMMMAGGDIGEVGQKILTVSSTISGISALLPMLKTPLGALTLGIGGAVLAIKMQKDAQEKAAKSIRDAAQVQADALTGSALSISEFGKSVGMQSIEEKAQQRRLGGDQASAFYQALTSGDMASTLSSYKEARAGGGNVSKIIAQDVQRLALQYNFTKEDVSSYISAAAEALDSYTLNADVRANLVEMLYSNGKTKVDLLENPEIKIDVVAQMKENFAKTPGGAALAIANQGVVKQIQESSKLVNEQVQTVDSLKEKLKELDILQGADNKKVDSLAYLSTAFEQSRAYNQAQGAGKLKEYFSGTFASNYISGLRDRAQGNLSLTSTSVNLMSQEEAAKKLSEIEKIVEQYNQKLKNGLQNTNSIFQSMSDQRTALELLKQEYESTNMTLEEYQDAQNQINDNQRALTQSLRDQANAAREAGTYDDWSKSTMNLIGIQVDASNATDALKQRFKDLQNSISELGNEDVEINFAASFKNFDGSLEDFLIQWETIEAAFDDKKLASEVSLWMSENSIDLEYINELSVALSSLEDAGVEIFVDGQVTPEAIAALNTVYQLAQLAAGKITASNPNLREGRGPISSDPNTFKFLKDLPSKIVPGTGLDNGVNDPKGSGGAGKGAEEDWLKYLINRFELTDKRLAAQIEKYQIAIDLQERQNELDQRSIELNNRALDQLSKQEDEINKNYDARVKALDEVASANDRVKQSEQSRISLASALASGDIAAAASQMAEITATNASNQIEDARSALESQRETSLKNLRVEVNGQLLTREEIQSRIDAVEETIYQRELKIREQQDAIYTIEQDRLKNSREREKIETKLYLLEQKKAITALDSKKINKKLTAEEKGWLAEYRAAYNQLTDQFNAQFGENVQRAMYGGKIKRFAFGNVVPGMGNVDRVPALLTPGEFVVRKSVAEANMPLLQALNSGAFSPELANITGPKYNIPRMSSPTVPSAGIDSSSITESSMYNNTYNVNVNVAGTNASPDDIANVVVAKLSRANAGSIRGIKY